MTECPLCESGMLCEVHDCKCGRIRIGMEVTELRNWNPDCPVHPWTDAMQAQNDRAVELQRQAAQARREAREAKSS